MKTNVSLVIKRELAWNIGENKKMAKTKRSVKKR